MKRRRRRGGTNARGLLVLVVIFVAAFVLGRMLTGGGGPQRHLVARHRAVPEASRVAAPVEVETPVDQPAVEESPPQDASSTPGASQAEAPGLVPSPQSSAGALPGATAPPAGASPVVSPTPVGTGGTAELAVIIDDCGQWPTIEKALIALPIPVTMSIMPQAPYAQAIQASAHSAGQGIMLHLPMEPRSGHTAGGGEITTTMDDASIEAQVRADLERVPLATGVNNHEGSKATADPRVMRDVAGVLASEGRFFVDSRTTAKTVAAQETAQAGIPTASRNVFLDDVVTTAAVEAQLETAAAIARARGQAIAIGHPKAAVLEALQAEIPRLQQTGVRFVLAQELVK
jgi:uncharacterized protein